ncbi:MAG: protoglobin domain-containing protein [Gammaproteobacteria bacterium]
MELSEAKPDVATILAKYDIHSSDIDSIQSVSDMAQARIGQWRDQWYSWLSTEPEFVEFFPGGDLLAQVQKLSAEYWLEFFAAEVDEHYLQSRELIGEVHARIGLPLPIYLAGMSRSLTVFLGLFKPDLSEEKMVQVTMSAMKLLHLDTEIVVQTYTERSNRALEAQTQLLAEMSTPVTQIWDGVLFLPVVGIIDSRRARDIMTNSLEEISSTRATQFIMDISGVAVVDTAVANYLIRITRATRLMGCSTTISGVSPAIAQTIVELGIDVDGVDTTATMQDALAGAVRNVDS